MTGFDREESSDIKNSNEKGVPFRRKDNQEIMRVFMIDGDNLVLGSSIVGKQMWQGGALNGKVLLNLLGFGSGPK